MAGRRKITLEPHHVELRLSPIEVWCLLKYQHGFGTWTPGNDRASYNRAVKKLKQSLPKCLQNDLQKSIPDHSNSKPSSDQDHTPE